MIKKAVIVKSLQDNLQILKIGYSFMQLVKAPYGDFAKINNLSALITDSHNYKQISQHLKSYAQCRVALQERYALGEIDLHQLNSLPENTLGYCYANHMLKYNFNPPPVKNAVDEFSYISTHLGETHDIWHVITGCDATKAGEIKLEAFYTAQIYPSALFLALLSKNLLKTAIEDTNLCSEHMDALTQGWQLGKQAKPLFGIRWNNLWNTPIEELRTELNLNQQVAVPVLH